MSQVNSLIEAIKLSSNDVKECSSKSSLKALCFQDMYDARDIIDTCLEQFANDEAIDSTNAFQLVRFAINLLCFVTNVQL